MKNKTLKNFLQKKEGGASLDLRQYRINVEKAVILGDFFKDNNLLTKIDFSNCRLYNEEALKMLQCISAEMPLKVLDLSHNFLGEDKEDEYIISFSDEEELKLDENVLEDYLYNLKCKKTS